jgi:hypothetical protein
MAPRSCTGKAGDTGRWGLGQAAGRGDFGPGQMDPQLAAGGIEASPDRALTVSVPCSAGAVRLTCRLHLQRRWER